MKHKELAKYQNDEIIKADFKRKFEFLEWVIIWIFWEIEHDDYYKKEIQYEEKRVYEALYDIKNNLENEWLNLSLVLNRLNIIIDNIRIPLSEIKFENHSKWLETSWHFVKIQTYLEEILKSSWVNIDTLDSTINKFEDDIQKVIYSK